MHKAGIKERAVSHSLAISILPCSIVVEEFLIRPDDENVRHLTRWNLEATFPPWSMTIANMPNVILTINRIAVGQRLGIDYEQKIGGKGRRMVSNHKTMNQSQFEIEK